MNLDPWDYAMHSLSWAEEENYGVEELNMIGWGDMH